MHECPAEPYVVRNRIAEHSTHLDVIASIEHSLDVDLPTIWSGYLILVQQSAQVVADRHKYTVVSSANHLPCELLPHRWVLDILLLCTHDTIWRQRTLQRIYTKSVPD